MKASLLQELARLRAARTPCAVVTSLPDGEAALVTDPATHPLGDEIAARLRSGKSGVVEVDGAEHFVRVHVPAARIVCIGAVHISQALWPMAQACGFDVTVCDPRTAFATPERFEGVRLLAEWPQEVMGELALDPYTALAALTHDPKIDDIPLAQALEAGCFYVGALGSRKTHAKRAARLIENGVTEESVGRIASPIGLDIGSANPAEIAVAILAEIIAALRKGA